MNTGQFRVQNKSSVITSSVLSLITDRLESQLCFMSQIFHVWRDVNSDTSCEIHRM